MEQQDTNINNAQRFFRWVNDSLYPSQRDKPRTMAELAERVVREIKDLRSRTSQGGDVDALTQMRVELARLRQQVDGLTAANAELGLLLRQPQDARDEKRQHQLAEEGMALIRSKLTGGVIIGVAKDEDNATFGLIVHRPTGEHVRAWLYRDECEVGPVHVEIEEECDA